MLSELFENIKIYGRYVKKNNLDSEEYWKKIVSFINAPPQKPAVELLNKILENNFSLKIDINWSDMTNLNEVYGYMHKALKVYDSEENKQKSNIDQLNIQNLLLVGYKIGRLLAFKELDQTNTLISNNSRQFYTDSKFNTVDTKIKLTPEQNEKIESNVEIKDLITNIDNFILGTMNFYQSGGAELEPFYSANIEQLTIENDNYRRVVYTGPNQQFVIMSIKPNDDIHMEIHKDHDQFIKIEKGTGLATVGNIKYDLKKEVGIIIPAGTKHRIQNTSNTEDLKLYTIYSPAEHPPNLIQLSNPDKPDKNLHIESTEQMSESELEKDNGLTESEENMSDDLDENSDKFKEKYLRYKNKYVVLKKFYSNYY